MKVNIQDIKTLRSKTQASYRACKEALLNSENLKDAEKYLIQKGLKVIDGTASDTNQHGVIKSYVHPGDRICAVVEIGCDTDFVAKTQEFQEFAKEIALQVASMKPLYTARSDISFEDETREMSFRQERLKKEGLDGEELEVALFNEMEQWFTEVCLLEQAYVRDGRKSVKELLAELVSKMQENCKIRRFARWEVGVEEEEEPQNIEPNDPFQKIRTPTVIALFLIILSFAFAFCKGF